MPTLAREEEDAWLIEIAGWQITQCKVDYAFSLVCYDPVSSVEFRISCPFVVRDGDGAESTIDPAADDPAVVVPALRMRHQYVEEARAFKDGTLVIRTANGITLTAPPHPQYEAWGISSHHREISMVSLPGGGLASW